MTKSDLPVLCTDRDLALLKVLRENYAKFSHLLCIWHINKNVQANCKSLFPSKVSQNSVGKHGIPDDDIDSTSIPKSKFFSLWIAIIIVPTEEGFDENLDNLTK